jgi:hypothetical protein
MISFPKDANRISVMGVTSNVDGVTPMLVYVDSSNAVFIEDGLTGSGFPQVNAKRDANRVPVMWGVSASDGVTPTAIYGDPTTGAILVRST